MTNVNNVNSRVGTEMIETLIALRASRRDVLGAGIATAGVALCGISTLLIAAPVSARSVDRGAAAQSTEGVESQPYALCWFRSAAPESS